MSEIVNRHYIKFMAKHVTRSVQCSMTLDWKRIFDRNLIIIKHTILEDFRMFSPFIVRVCVHYSLHFLNCNEYLSRHN